jgi:predicted nucleotidyltransferase
MCYNFEKTVKLFSEHHEIDAIVLGGSRAICSSDEFSDYDLYIYLNSPLDTGVRKKILEQFCSFVHVGLQFYEEEDHCVFKNGVAMEIMYRNIEETRKDLHRILVDCVAQSGYTTCNCLTVLRGKILHDPRGIYREMVEEFSMPYPEKLRENILRKNWILMESCTISHKTYLEMAAKRNDLVLLNKRIAGYLDCYFEILFAFNKAYLTGEKKLIKYACEMCKHLPENFTENMNKLLVIPNKNIMRVVTEMTSALENLLSTEYDVSTFKM